MPNADPSMSPSLQKLAFSSTFTEFDLPDFETLLRLEQLLELVNIPMFWLVRLILQDFETNFIEKDIYFEQN